jgi:hypothetical protein
MNRIRYMYKIHSVNTAQGTGRSACNNTFYETEQEAINAAHRCVQGDPACDGIVVYKAIRLIQRVSPPISSRVIRHDGTISEHDPMDCI